MVTTRRGGARRRNPERAARVSSSATAIAATSSSLSRRADHGDEEGNDDDHSHAVSSSRRPRQGRQTARRSGNNDRTSTNNTETTSTATGRARRATRQRRVTGTATTTNNNNAARASRRSNSRTTSTTRTTRRSTSRARAPQGPRDSLQSTNMAMPRGGASNSNTRRTRERATTISSTAATAKRRGGKTKSRQKPTKRLFIQIETLINQGDWDEVKARVRRLTSPNRLGTVLSYCLFVIARNRNDFYLEDDENAVASVVGIPRDLLKQLFTHIRRARDSKKYKESRAIGRREGERRRLRQPQHISLLRGSTRLLHRGDDNVDDNDDSNDEIEADSTTTSSSGSEGESSEDSSLFSDDSSDYYSDNMLNDYSNSDTSSSSSSSSSDDDIRDYRGFYNPKRSSAFERKFSHQVLNTPVFRFEEFCYGAPNPKTIEIVLTELALHFDIHLTPKYCEYILAKIWTKYISERQVTSFETVSNPMDMKRTNPQLATMCDKTRFLWQHCIRLQEKAKEKKNAAKSNERNSSDEVVNASNRHANNNTGADVASESTALKSVDDTKTSADGGGDITKTNKTTKNTPGILSKMIQKDYPPVLLWFWLKMYPEEARMRDEVGRLPLHYGIYYDLMDHATSGTNRSTVRNEISDDSDDDDDDDNSDTRFVWQQFNDQSSDLLVILATEFVKEHEKSDNAWSSKVDLGNGFSMNTVLMRELLEAYPEASAIPDPITQKLPLAAFLQTGMTTREQTVREQRDKEFIDLGCTLPLLRSYGASAASPNGVSSSNTRGNDVDRGVGSVESVLNRVDPETRMYPFMMVEHADIDLAYTLLRENPSVLQQFIRETNYEQHLKRKVSSLETTIDDLQAQVKALKEQLELAQKGNTNCNRTDGETCDERRKRIRTS